MSEANRLMQLIGTETCSHCGLLTECLLLPDDGEEPYSACLKCINDAFLSYWLPNFKRHATTAQPQEQKR